MRQQYVVGFLFSPDRDHVALIRKNRPQWQAGLLNGIGGKIEEGEKPQEAIVREFMEEAGVEITDWELTLEVEGSWGDLYVFRSFSEDVYQVSSMEDEEVHVYPIHKVGHTGQLIGYNAVPNLTWVIPLCLDTQLKVPHHFQEQSYSERSVEDIRDRCWGTLYGQAIGDALGIPLEWRSSTWISNLGLSDDELLTYRPSVRKGKDVSWEAGEWSDDTDQALCIVRAHLNSWQKAAYIDTPEGAPLLAEELVKWLETNGKGSGRLTRGVLTSPGYLKDPIAAAKDYWEKQGKNAAPNGAVMRCAVVGTLKWSADSMIDAAVYTAQITHYDPRCVASSVAVASAVWHLVHLPYPIEDAIAFAQEAASRWHLEAPKFMQMNLEELNLDEGMGDRTRRPPVGYTYKCLGAAFWALRKYAETSSFEESLLPILKAGGDTDTNAAVACALIGAAAGFSSLPKHLTDGLAGDLGSICYRVYGG